MVIGSMFVLICSLDCAYPCTCPRLDRTEAQSGSVRSTGKEDGREYEPKPSTVVQRVRIPPGKGQSASRKPGLRGTEMVARSVGEQVPKLRESASKSPMPKPTSSGSREQHRRGR